MSTAGAASSFFLSLAGSPTVSVAGGVFALPSPEDVGVLAFAVNLRELEPSGPDVMRRFLERAVEWFDVDAALAGVN